MKKYFSLISALIAALLLMGAPQSASAYVSSAYDNVSYELPDITAVSASDTVSTVFMREERTTATITAFSRHAVSLNTKMQSTNSGALNEKWKDRPAWRF